MTQKESQAEEFFEASEHTGSDFVLLLSSLKYGRVLLKRIRRLQKRNRILKTLYDEQSEREDKFWKCEEMDTTDF